jgi:hypothetical protein
MMMGMADTFDRATQQHELTSEMKTFANEFHQKFKAQMINEQSTK